MRKRRATVVALAFAAAAGGFWLWPGTDAGPQLPPRVEARDAVSPEKRAASAPAALPDIVASDAALPAPDAIAPLRARLAQSSLRDAQTDGELDFDANGRLIPDAGLRRLFDHFLSLSGEFSLADIRALVADAVRRLSDDAATAQALTWFDRYTDLLRAIDASAFPADALARAEALRTLRRQYLGTEAADAMFGSEDAALDLALARQAVRAADDLDDAERALWLAELDESRPAAVRDILRESQDLDLAQAQTRQLDALDADAATRHAERAALWGEDAARRLAQLDAERADWDARIAHYRTARTTLGTDPRALETWLHANFSDAERRRLTALESIDALDGGPP